MHLYQPRVDLKTPRVSISHARKQSWIVNPFHQYNPMLVQVIQWKINGEKNLEQP